MSSDIDSNDRLKQKHLLHRPFILFDEDVNGNGHCSDVRSPEIRW